MCQLCNLVAIAELRSHSNSQPQSLSNWGYLVPRSTLSLATRASASTASVPVSSNAHPLTLHK